MSDPTISPTNTATTSPVLDPTTTATSTATSLSLSPHQLEVGVGFTHINLGVGAAKLDGPIGQISIGQAISPFFINGVFRFGSLQDKQSHKVNMFYLGAETGLELAIDPKFVSLFASLGIGTNIFSAKDFEVEAGTTRTFDNASTLAFDLEGGARLFSGILVLAGAWQPNLGLEATSEDPYTAPKSYNPSKSAYAVVLLDAAKITEAIRRTTDGFTPDAFSLGSTFKEFADGTEPGDGIQAGILVDATMTVPFEPAQIENEETGEMECKNILRGFDSKCGPTFNHLKLSLERKTNEDVPVGFNVSVSVGEDSALVASSDQLSSGAIAVQQLYGAIRLPIHNGITLKGPLFATPIGAEVIEGPLNNQISRSLQFNWAIPFRHMGLLGEMPIWVNKAEDKLPAGSFHPELSAIFGVLHGWDNVFKFQTQAIGPTLLGGVDIKWTTPENEDITAHETKITTTVGKDIGHARFLVDALHVWNVPCASLALTLNYDFGREGDGNEGFSGGVWHALSLMGNHDLSGYFGLSEKTFEASARAEVFGDPNGVRTGAEQTLLSLATTLKWSPFKWLPLRAEFRHDHSDKNTFLSGTEPTHAQNTFGIGVGVIYP